MDYNAEQLKEAINPAFYPLLWNRDRYLILWGGGDSGKSRFAGQKIMARTLYGCRPNSPVCHKVVIWRKTKPAVRDSAFSLMKGEIKRWNISKITKTTVSPMRIQFPNAEQIFTGIDDPLKIKSIENVTMVWLEEMTELNIEDFWQIDLRLRGETGDYKQIIGSFNPVDETSWVKKEFFDEREGVIDVTPKYWPKCMQRKQITTKVRGKDIITYATLMHSTYHDNKFSTDEDAAILEGYKEKDEQYYKIYCKGQWGVKRGLIFDKYEIVKDWPDREKMLDSGVKVANIDCGGFGLDFGYSNNPSALVECAFVGSDLYLREHIYERGLTNQQLAARMKPIFTGYIANNIIVADCAEPKSIREIRNESYNITGCEKGPDSILHGIQRLKQYNIKIHEDSTNLIHEFGHYKWAEHKTLRGPDGAPLCLNTPVDLFNHAIDAARYCVTKLKGKIKANVTISSDDPREERKEVIAKEGYDALNDDELWKSQDA